MLGHNWKNINEAVASEIKRNLKKLGGIDCAVNSPHEQWRVKLIDSTFTYYGKGTLYGTPSNMNSEKVTQACRIIDTVAGSAYVLPSKDILIGLDETGKGEILGPVVLAGVLFPKHFFSRFNSLAGPSDTKKNHRFEYWDDIFQNLTNFSEYGFKCVLEHIHPQQLENNNLNLLMDTAYKRILTVLLKDIDLSSCRIVLDDYGAGPKIRNLLTSYKKSEIIIATGSESRYLETKIASLVAKRETAQIIKSLNEDKNFRINGCTVGTGNCNNPQTLQWLLNWQKTGKEWPWFIKKSFKTLNNIK